MVYTRKLPTYAVSSNHDVSGVNNRDRGQSNVSKLNTSISQVKHSVITARETITGQLTFNVDNANNHTIDEESSDRSYHSQPSISPTAKSPNMNSHVSAYASVPYK